MFMFIVLTFKNFYKIIPAWKKKRFCSYQSNPENRTAKPIQPS